MRRIKLQNMARFMTVDDRDYKRVSKYRWFGHPNRKGGMLYAVASVCLEGGGSKTIYAHRLIANAGPGDIVDHVNRRPLDNRAKNLRFCTRAQNAWNTPNLKGSESRFKGVSADRRPDGTVVAWRSWIRVNRKRYSLGSFDTERQAAMAYDAAATELHGRFAYTNFGRKKKNGGRVRRKVS